MTDRELLEAAAKAAGVRHIEYTNNYDGKNGLVMCDEVGRHQNDWSPLNDDGDALRLAVKLNIWPVKRYERPVIFVQEGEAYFVELAEEPIGNDPYAATRRAIVRAAAEIGKAME